MAKGAGPKPGKPSTKSRAPTANPKLRGAPAGQANVMKGMYVGGYTDAQARTNANSQGIMLHKQLKKNKSGSSPVK